MTEQNGNGAAPSAVPRQITMVDVKELCRVNPTAARDLENILLAREKAELQVRVEVLEQTVAELTADPKKKLDIKRAPVSVGADAD